MSSPVKVSYDCFDDLIVQLRAEAHDSIADLIHRQLHLSAWTTGSELLGEIGLAVVRFQQSCPNASPELQQAMTRALDMVRRVWPNLQ